MATAEEPLEECAANEHHEKFDPALYLDAFYKTAAEDEAMQVVLFFLPGIVYRLPSKINTLLDLGAGPTVYIPIVFRHRAERIFTSDYSPRNRAALEDWIRDRSSFNWSEVCRWIANIEASRDTGDEMQKVARAKMRAVFEVDVQTEDGRPLKSATYRADELEELPSKFQVISTIFCLEYSSESLEGYQRAVTNVCSLIEDGGFLLQGGVLDATTYSFGGKSFRCHRLLKTHIEATLRQNNMAWEEKDPTGAVYKFITHDDIFLLVSQKKTPKKAT